MSDALTSTYTDVGSGTYRMAESIFEDVDGIVTNISPHKTPFIASIGKGTATNTTHEWLTDVLKTAGSNAAKEGADPTAATRQPPSRKSNYTQIVQDAFLVSGTLDAVNLIGRKSQSTYELEKSLKYVSTCIEYAALNETAQAGSAAAARKMAGAFAQVSTNDKSYESYSADNDFDETKLMEMAQACYEQGGEPSTLLVPPTQARRIADWDQNSRITVNANATEKTLVMAVMVLETPFGRMRVTIDLFIADDDQSGTIYNKAMLYDPTTFELAVLRPTRTHKLAKTGDNTKYQTVWEGTLAAKAENANGVCGKCATDLVEAA